MEDKYAYFPNIHAYCSVQPNLYVTYELDKAPLQQPLVFKSFTSSVRVSGQEYKQSKQTVLVWLADANKQLDRCVSKSYISRKEAKKEA